MKSDYYVYGYFEPGSEQPFYIGKGRKERARSHLWLFKKTQSGGHFYVRLRELATEGITPDVRTLHEGLTDQDAKDKEIDLITFWGRIDIGTGCLCNHTRGGDGVTGIKRSAETRAKISDSNRRRVCSAETKAKISRSNTGKIPSAETRAKMSRVRTGKTPSDKAKRALQTFTDGCMRPVESYDFDTGQLVKSYPSITATTTDGFTSSSVSMVCRGRQKAHGGLGWRYA